MDHQMVLRYEAVLWRHAPHVGLVGIDARVHITGGHNSLALVPDSDEQPNTTITKSRGVCAQLRLKKEHHAPSLCTLRLALGLRLRPDHLVRQI